MQLINFAPYNSPTMTLFADNGMLKFEDIITCTKLAFKFKKNILPIDLSDLFKYCHVHSYTTHTVSKEGFFVPMINATSYGINTLRYSIPVIWNDFSSISSQISKLLFN